MPGKSAAGAALTALLEGSDIRMSHLEGDERVQDPYCLRCHRRWQAPPRSATQAARTLTVEANAGHGQSALVWSTGEIARAEIFMPGRSPFAA